jgi:hypothetical protein
MSLRGICTVTDDNGHMCGRYASNIDPERGCVVCDRHLPDRTMPRVRRTPPSDEVDAIRVAAADAVELAERGKGSEGYGVLLAGLRRAEGLRAAGEPWGGDLVTRWEAALEHFAAIYRRGRR